MHTITKSIMIILLLGSIAHTPTHAMEKKESRQVENQIPLPREFAAPNEKVIASYSDEEMTSAIIHNVENNEIQIKTIYHALAISTYCTLYTQEMDYSSPPLHSLPPELPALPVESNQRENQHHPSREFLTQNSHDAHSLYPIDLLADQERDL